MQERHTPLAQVLFFPRFPLPCWFAMPGSQGQNIGMKLAPFTTERKPIMHTFHGALTHGIAAAVLLLSGGIAVYAQTPGGGLGAFGVNFAERHGLFVEKHRD